MDSDALLLISDVSDTALERAAGHSVEQAFTMNFCTYNYYQCGPIIELPTRD